MNTRTTQRTLITTLICGLFVWTTSCTKNADQAGQTTSSAAATSSGPSNAELKVGISQEFENFNPLVASMAATTYMYSMVNRALVYLDVDAKWQPQLATTIPTLENGLAKITEVGGKKVLTAQWEIQESAKWGDGTPVTCKDFALARKVAASPNVTVAEKETYTLVEKIEFDPATPKKCLFTYEKVRWDFYQLGQFKPLPAHLEEAVFNKFEKEPQGYEKNSIFTKEPTNKGLYNGPYVITEVKLGDHITFEPNTNFYGAQPKIKKIIVKLIQNTGTMEANLRSGTIDMISTLGLTFDQALEFDKKVQAENLPYVVTFTPSLVYEHIDFNLDNPILKDLKVRQAMVHAIDRDSLTKSLFEGKQIPAIHFASPKDPWFADASKVKIYKYSKKEAEKILDDAGWKLGDDGIRAKGGKKLSFNFMTTAGNKTRETVQTYLQEQWKAIGIDVVIKNEPARVFFAETTKKRKFDLAMYAWVSSPENNPRSTLSTKSIPSQKNSFSGQNQPGWSNKRVDELIDAIDLEFSHEKRIALATEIQKLYTEDAPVIPLYYRADISVVPKNMTGFKVPGHQFYETNNVENWNLESVP